MLLLEPNETAWDLRWRMFGIPVRVHPMFWLVSLLMSGDRLGIGFQYVLVWVGCVFVSILIHELGHVLMGMAFGSRGHIILYGFGGLAVGSNRLETRWQRIAVCFAGPLAGFLLLGAVFAFLLIRDPEVFPAYVEFAKADLGLSTIDEEMAPLMVQVLRRGYLEFVLISDLVFINLLWGLVNLLPIWPLDGGQISRDVCEGLSPEGGLKLSLGISLLTAGLLAVNCVMAMNGRAFLPMQVGSWYPALLFGLLAFQSFQLLQHVHAQERQRQRWTDDHWDRED